MNKKSVETFTSDQNECELRNLKPGILLSSLETLIFDNEHLGTKNDVQVSVTCDPDFTEEKISEPVSIICPFRPQMLKIQAIQTEKPYSIGIKWKIDDNSQDEITSFKIFLNGKLHSEIDSNRDHLFKYEFAKLQADETYRIYVKSYIEQKKLSQNVYQCSIESNPSNELLLKCSTPPKGTLPRIEQMYPNGVDIVWDPSIECGNVKVTVCYLTFLFFRKIFSSSQY